MCVELEGQEGLSGRPAGMTVDAVMGGPGLRAFSPSLLHGCLLGPRCGAFGDGWRPRPFGLL